MGTELDVRIAKAKGWRLEETKDTFFPDVKAYLRWAWVDADGKQCFYALSPSKQEAIEALPNWSSSLDLMHELESEMLEDDLDHDRAYGYYEQYCSCLRDIVRTHRGATIHATAEQKARAWLKAKGCDA